MVFTIRRIDTILRGDVVLEAMVGLGVALGRGLRLMAVVMEVRVRVGEVGLGGVIPNRN
jgi:hypothetical protein